MNSPVEVFVGEGVRTRMFSITLEKLNDFVILRKKTGYLTYPRRARDSNKSRVIRIHPGENSVQKYLEECCLAWSFEMVIFIIPRASSKTVYISWVVIGAGLKGGNQVCKFSIIIRSELAATWGDVSKSGSQSKRLACDEGEANYAQEHDPHRDYLAAHLVTSSERQCPQSCVR